MLVTILYSIAVNMGHQLSSMIMKGVRKLISICFGILEFQKLWRSVPVDSMDEEKIEEYLKRQGISSMQDVGPKKIVSNFL